MAGTEELLVVSFDSLLQALDQKLIILTQR